MVKRGSAVMTRSTPARAVAAPRAATSAPPAVRQATVAVVLGTRPEIVKLAPVLRLLGDRRRFIFTGQHYDERLAGAFFRELGVPPPDVRLEVGGLHRGEQIGVATSEITRELARSAPDVVVVQGDTNAALAGALAANATGTPLVHIEAGLRSYDRAMPEEHNRVLIDHLADRCCAPTAVSAANLVEEGIAVDRVHVTGNTVVEAVRAMLPPASARDELLRTFGLAPSAYVLATFHRPENVDDRANLVAILRALRRIPLPVVLPLHPRTAARIRAWNLGAHLDAIRVVDPLPYRAFLALAAESACLVSDSGGVQEEVSVLKRSVVVVRASTERPEVVGTFSLLVEPGPSITEIVGAWLDDLGALHERLATLPSPYGTGTASRRCVEHIEQLVVRSGRARKDDRDNATA